MSVVGVSSYKPSPLSYKAPAPSYVDKVLITSNESEHFLVKVIINIKNKKKSYPHLSLRAGSPER